MNSSEQSPKSQLSEIQPERGRLRRLLGMEASRAAVKAARLQTEAAEFERQRNKAEQALAFLVSVPDMARLTDVIVEQTPLPEGSMEPRYDGKASDKEEFDEGDAWELPSERDLKIYAGLSKLEAAIRSDSTPNVINVSYDCRLGHTIGRCSHGSWQTCGGEYTDKGAFSLLAWENPEDVRGVEYEHEDDIYSLPKIKFAEEPKGQILRLTLNNRDMHNMEHHPSLEETQLKVNAVLEIQNLILSQTVAE